MSQLWDVTGSWGGSSVILNVIPQCGAQYPQSRLSQSHWGWDSLLRGMAESGPWMTTESRACLPPKYCLWLSLKPERNFYCCWPWEMSTLCAATNYSTITRRENNIQFSMCKLTWACAHGDLSISPFLERFLIMSCRSILKSLLLSLCVHFWRELLLDGCSSIWAHCWQWVKTSTGTGLYNIIYIIYMI